MNFTTTLTLKGISILFVIIGHFISHRYLNVPLYLNQVATYSVDVFLAISGYGLFKSFQKNGLNNYFKKRFIKVLIPYSLVTTALLIGSYFLFNKRLSLLGSVSTILGINPYFPLDGTMWFILFIIIWYVLFFIIFKLPLKNSYRILLLFLFSLIFLSGYIFKYTDYNFFFRYGIQYHALAFPVGIFYASIYDNNIKPLKNKFFIGFMLFLAFLILFYISFKFGTKIFPSLTGVCAFLSLNLIIDSLQINNKFFIFLGKYSYELYLFEGIFLAKRLFYITNNNYINIFIYFTIISILSFSLSLFCKKVYKILNF